MDNTKEKKINIIGYLGGGSFLKEKRFTGQLSFILYVFLLVLIYITINLGVEKTQLKQRRNQRELKNLKADYTSKSAKLQYQSKRGEIEIKLIQQGSNLEKPKKPAKLVEIPANK